MNTRAPACAPTVTPNWWRTGNGQEPPPVYLLGPRQFPCRVEGCRVCDPQAVITEAKRRCCDRQPRRSCRRRAGSCSATRGARPADAPGRETARRRAAPGSTRWRCCRSATATNAPPMPERAVPTASTVWAGAATAVARNRRANARQRRGTRVWSSVSWGRKLMPDTQRSCASNRPASLVRNVGFAPLRGADISNGRKNLLHSSRCRPLEMSTSASPRVEKLTKIATAPLQTAGSLLNS